MKRTGFLAGVAAIAAGLVLRRAAAAANAPRPDLATEVLGSVMYPVQLPPIEITGGAAYRFTADVDGAEAVVGYFDASGRDVACAGQGISIAPLNATTARIGLRSSPRSLITLANPRLELGHAMRFGPHSG